MRCTAIFSGSPRTSPTAERRQDVHIDVSFLPALGAAFLLVFARAGTMVMLLPGLGEQNVSPRLKLTIALVLAAVLLPLHRRAYHIDVTALMPAIVMLVEEIM